MGTPWDQRDNESNRAYQGFSCYRDLGPATRSLDKAFRAYKGGKEGAIRGRAPTYFQQWSKRHGWVQRARAWDADLERERQQAARSVWLERTAAARELQWELGEKLVLRVREMLQWPLVEEVSEQDGAILVTRPARWSLRDAVGMAMTASKLMRIATGLTTQSELRREPTKGLTEDERSLDLSGLTDEELEVLAGLLDRARRLQH